MLQRFGRCNVSAESERASRIVYCYEALPLLDCEGFSWIDAEADGLALRVEGVEIDVGNYAEGGLRAVGFQLVQLFVCEFRLGDAARRCDGEWGGGEIRRRRGHAAVLGHNGVETSIFSKV